MVKTKILLLGMLLVICSSIVYYFYGYMDNRWIQDATTGTIYLGWFIVLFATAEALNERIRKVSFSKNRLAGGIQMLSKAAGYILWAVLMVLNIYMVEILSDYRVKHILATQPTSPATATVTGMERRISHGRAQPYAIVEYQSASGKIIQALYNYRNEYTKGQVLQIAYSISHPDMFYVQRR